MYETEDINRFWSKVVKSDHCWTWSGGQDKDGYGRIKVKGKHYRSNRFVWMFMRGAIPPGMVVCHHCDNPKCVRLDHLYAGTISDNARDMLMRGRDHVTGDKNYFHVLTEDQAREIYLIGATTLRTYTSIASDYGVSPLAVQRICLGVSWKHLGLPKLDRNGPRNPGLPSVVKKLRDEDKLPWRKIEEVTGASSTTLHKAYNQIGPYKVKND